MKTRPHQQHDMCHQINSQRLRWRYHRHHVQIYQWEWLLSRTKASNAHYDNTDDNACITDNITANKWLHHHPRLFYDMHLIEHMHWCLCVSSQALRYYQHHQVCTRDRLPHVDFFQFQYREVSHILNVTSPIKDAWICWLECLTRGAGHSLEDPQWQQHLVDAFGWWDAWHKIGPLLASGAHDESCGLDWDRIFEHLHYDHINMLNS